MAKQLADNRESESCASADTGMRVTQVMNSHVLKTCAFRYSTPRPVKVCARLLGIIADDDVGAVACNHRELTLPPITV
jgi:hypothetical protein